MKNKEWLGFSAALGAAFFWSFSFIWVKIAYEAYEPITVVVLRLGISAVLILIIAALMKKLQRPTKKDFGLLLLMAFFEPFIYFLGESYGLKYITSTVAAIIVATIPLLTPVAAWYFLREKISWTNLAGMILSFIGVAVVVLNKSLQFAASPLGVGLEFCAVFAAISYSIVLKSLASRYNSLTIIAFQSLIGVIMFLPIWMVLEYNGYIATPFHPKAFQAIILLAIFSSTLAFVFFTQSIRQLGLNRANTFINLIPVFVAVLSFFILREVLNLQKIVGISIVVAGLFLAQAKRRKIQKGIKAYEIHNT
jgi:drug/metabolite transporter (DMT)-like permease